MSINSVLVSPDLRCPVFLVEFQQGPRYWRYTTATDVDQIFSGRKFARNSISVDRVSQSASEGPGGEGTIILSSDDPVVKVFDVFLPVEPVTCLVQYYEANDSSKQLRSILSGDVASVVDADDGTSKLTVKPLYQSFNRAVPWQLQQATCVLVLFGVQCGVSSELYRHAATSVQVFNTYVESASWDNPDPTYFKGGYVRCRRTRETRFVIQQDGGKLYIGYPFSEATPSDTFDAWAGCMRTGDVCSSKFNNKINMMAFEKIPTKNLFKTGLK